MTTLAICAQQLRDQFLHQPFGVVRFWGFAVVRPNDQFFELVSVAEQPERLDLVIVEASHRGLASVLSIWQPEGLLPTPTGIKILSGARLLWDEYEAWGNDPLSYQIRTPRGAGTFEKNQMAALTLES
jgi:hypothetical protein